MEGSRGSLTDEYGEKKEVYKIYGVANLRQPILDLRATQSIQRFFCTNLACKTSFNCTRCMQRQE